MTQAATEAEFDLMLHALGGERGRHTVINWRNYFCASPGTDDDAAWAALVRRGMAFHARWPTDAMPYNTYAVTPAGIQFVETRLHGAQGQDCEVGA